MAVSLQISIRNLHSDLLHNHIFVHLPPQSIILISLVCSRLQTVAARYVAKENYGSNEVLMLLFAHGHVNVLRFFQVQLLYPIFSYPAVNTRLRRAAEGIFFPLLKFACALINPSSTISSLKQIIIYFLNQF